MYQLTIEFHKSDNRNKSEINRGNFYFSLLKQIELIFFSNYFKSKLMNKKINKEFYSILVCWYLSFLFCRNITTYKNAPIFTLKARFYNILK